MMWDLCIRSHAIEQAPLHSTEQRERERAAVLLLLLYATLVAIKKSVKTVCVHATLQNVVQV